jgi:hypothetical protein
MLSTAMPDKRSKELFAKLYEACDPASSDDAAVLRELGRALAAWHSPELADRLVKHLHSTQDAPRAVVVIESAGGPPAGTAGPDYVAWWKAQRQNWREARRIEGEPWRGLGPDLLGPALTWDQIDPDDKRWYKELEVKRPDLKNFDVAFAIDVSGSMSPAINWLRRDVGSMMAVLAIFAKEPRVGITTFSGPNYRIRTTPLTGNVASVRDTVSGLGISGGGDEQMRDALAEAIGRNRWATSGSSRKVVVFVSDEEMVASQVAGAAAVATEAAKHGFRIYTVSPEHKIPATLVTLAEQGNGESFALDLPRAAGRGKPARAGDTSNAGTMGLLSRIIGDALTPEYRDRVVPLIAIVFAMNAAE